MLRTQYTKPGTRTQQMQNCSHKVVKKKEKEKEKEKVLN